MEVPVIWHKSSSASHTNLSSNIPLPITYGSCFHPSVSRCRIKVPDVGSKSPRQDIFLSEMSCNSCLCQRPNSEIPDHFATPCGPKLVKRDPLQKNLFKPRFGPFTLSYHMINKSISYMDLCLSPKTCVLPWPSYSSVEHLLIPSITKYTQLTRIPFHASSTDPAATLCSSK